LLRPNADESPGQEHHAHRRKDRPTLPDIADHLAKRIRESGRNKEDGQYLKKVVNGVGFSKGMRRVGVEEPATVCPEHFDRLLRSDGP